MDELIYNLCDNAIKYNRKGGSVTVSTAEENGQPVLCVADTGIGIPAAEQDRVFERFYRVDKSHSRAIGGTGLGLSIVKHAAATTTPALHWRAPSARVRPSPSPSPAPARRKKTERAAAVLPQRLFAHKCWGDEVPCRGRHAEMNEY